MTSPTRTSSASTVWMTISPPAGIVGSMLLLVTGLACQWPEPMASAEATKATIVTENRNVTTAAIARRRRPRRGGRAGASAPVWAMDTSSEIVCVMASLGSVSSEGDLAPG